MLNFSSSTFLKEGKRKRWALTHKASKLSGPCLILGWVEYSSMRFLPHHLCQNETNFSTKQALGFACLYEADFHFYVILWSVHFIQQSPKSNSHCLIWKLETHALHLAVDAEYNYSLNLVLAIYQHLWETCSCSWKFHLISLDIQRLYIARINASSVNATEPNSYLQFMLGIAILMILCLPSHYKIKITNYI